jgi:hypothetical protein
MTEPNNESVRTPLPARPDKPAPTASVVKPSPVRILVPSRTPYSAAVSPLLRPLPKPPGSEISGESKACMTPVPAAPETPPASSIHPGPKKETARISILPRCMPGANAAAHMTETQPPLDTSKPRDPFAAIPRSFCWTLFGIAALIFLIQIWNYVVS